MKISFVILLLGIAFSAFAPLSVQQVEAQEALYGLAHQGSGSPSSLYQINTSTGAPNLIGPTGFNQCGAMDYHTLSQTMFATCSKDDGSPALVTVNLNNGMATEVAPTSFGGGNNIFDISFRNSDNTLFGTYIGLQTCVTLMDIDINSGAVNEIGDTTQCAPGNGLAFSNSDVLYHFDVNGPTLYTVNPITGVSTPLVLVTYSIPTDEPRLNAMDTQPSTNTLFASVNDGSGGQGPNYLGTVDTTTGLVTILGQSQNGLDAIAFVSDRTVVGGDFLEIDTTSLLLAAASSPIAWLSSLTIAVIGIGAFILVRNPSNIRNIKAILQDYIDKL